MSASISSSFFANSKLLSYPSNPFPMIDAQSHFESQESHFRQENAQIIQASQHRRSRNCYKRNPELSEKLESAVTELIERSDMGSSLNFKEVAERYDIPYNTLRENYFKAVTGISPSSMRDRKGSIYKPKTERRKLTYSEKNPDNLKKLNEAIEFLNTQSSTGKPNIGAAAKAFGIPYNTVRDHWIKEVTGKLPKRKRHQPEDDTDSTSFVFRAEEDSQALSNLNKFAAEQLEREQLLQLRTISNTEQGFYPVSGTTTTKAAAAAAAANAINASDGSNSSGGAMTSEMDFDTFVRTAAATSGVYEDFH